MTIPLETLLSTPAARTIPRPADRDQWLLARRPWFNASAAASLFNEHPFVDLATIVRAKLEPHAGERAQNDAMRRGSFLEPAIANWWSDEHGIALVEPEVMYVNGPMLATLDRVPIGNTTDAVEIKTTAKYVTGVERYWWWQCQAQMYCADLERIHVAVVDASMSLRTYVVERDEPAIARMVERAHEVMTFVNVGEWPPSVPERTDVIRHTDRVIELDPATADIFKAWLEIREERDKLEALELNHKNVLMNVLGDAQAATIEGAPVLTYRAHARRNVDLNRLRAEHADLAAELTTETLVRVLRPISGSER